MTHWLYIYEPRTSRHLLMVSRDGEVTVYWRQRDDGKGGRPVGVEPGSPRWIRLQTLARGQHTPAGDLMLVHQEDGGLSVRGKPARGDRYAQLLQHVDAGVGEPARLGEVWQ